jgi:23S rRNA (cytidine1920-2'-O)/16S rRNA (cytidine1409-2'-O)-methyltransferase
MRADHLIVLRGLAPSRSAAQRLIDQGAIQWRQPNDRHDDAWRVPRKAGDELPDQCELVVTDDAELRWASRAGLKLQGALQRTGLAVQGFTCLDVGQSTGGFTDVLLAQGAAHVVGVDVGHGQLHPRLAVDPRVTVFEGANARALDDLDLQPARFDLVVADLSFISLRLVLPALVRRLQPDHGHALLLVKPQFELQRGDLGKGGVVTDPVKRHQALEGVVNAIKTLALCVRDAFESAVPGGDGNQEFFVWAQARTDLKPNTP